MIRLDACLSDHWMMCPDTRCTSLPALWTAVTRIAICLHESECSDQTISFDLRSPICFYFDLLIPCFLICSLLAIGSKFCISSRCGDMGRCTDGHWCTVYRIALICCSPVNLRAVFDVRCFLPNCNCASMLNVNKKWAQSVSISSAPTFHPTITIKPALDTEKNIFF